MTICIMLFITAIGGRTDGKSQDKTHFAWQRFAPPQWSGFASPRTIGRSTFKNLRDRA